MNTDNNFSTTFRTRQEPPKEETTPIAKETTNQAIVDSVEIPYLDYQTQHGHPLVVDLFNLGDNWDVFAQEVGLIDVYFKGKIHEGIYANNVDAIKDEIKKMEKLLDIRKETRSVVKLGVLSSHIKFLIDTDNLRHNIQKFGQR